MLCNSQSTVLDEGLIRVLVLRGPSTKILTFIRN